MIRRDGYRQLLAGLVLGAGTVQADDLALLSDEFSSAATRQNWSDITEVEGWGAASFEVADIHTTTPGHFHVVPAANTWFGHLRGLLFFKEIEGDFIATTRVRVLSRHNAEDPTEVPNRSFTLTGIFAHGPRTITQAAPDPYTTAAVWPPGDHGSDYVANTENYIFLSYGSAGNPGTRQFEIKATRNSSSQLYYDSTGISQSATDAWLQMVRVGDTIVCLRKHSIDGDWIVENRYPNPDHPFPAFGSTLQVGITAYTDWPTAAPFNAAGLEASYHFNYAPPTDGQPDLISQIDYFRFRRPHTNLTETVLQNMSVSYDPNSNTTADPPVLLAASLAAAPYLGETPNTAYNGNNDSDLDGHADGIERALGSDPDQPESTPVYQGVVSGEESTFSFTPAIPSGVTWSIEASTDLSTWSVISSRPGNATAWSTPIPGYTVSEDMGTGEVTVTPPGHLPRVYIRIGVL